MTLTLELTPEQDSKLRQAAAAQGLKADGFVHNLLLDRLAQEGSSCETKPSQQSDEWLNEFSALIEDMKTINAPSSPVDTLGRENLYEDRGV